MLKGRSSASATKKTVKKSIKKSVKKTVTKKSSDIPTGEDLNAVMEALCKSTVFEATIKNGDAVITLQKGKASCMSKSLPVAPKSVEKSETEKKEEVKDVLDILSKDVGIFLRAKSEKADPYVKLRDNIKKGQVVALMKYMGINHEIRSDVEGKLVEILVEDGQAVVYGQPLFRLKK